MTTTKSSSFNSRNEDVTVKTKNVKTQTTKKKYDRVLILGGGGVKGAFQIGAIKALMEQGIKWDLIIGVSVGALTGSYLAMYNKDEIIEGVAKLEEFWRNKIKNETIYKPRGPGFWKYAIAFFKKSVNSTEPLRKLIEENWDFDKLKKSDVDFILGTTSLLTGRYENINKYHDGMTDWIMASSAFPILFPSIKIANNEYIDGGLRNNVPINDALQFDVKHIDVILCEPYGDHAKSLKKNKNLIDVIVRTTEILSDELFLNDLKEICFYQDIAIDVYSPVKYLTSETLNFDQALINEMVDIGYTSRRKVSVKRKNWSRYAITSNQQQEDSEKERGAGTGRNSFPPAAIVTDSLGISACKPGNCNTCTDESKCSSAKEND